MPNFIAVIVLYRMPLADSPSYRTLMETQREAPGIGASWELMVADNSAETQDVPDDFVGTYVFDGRNRGLARRYNQALRYAEQRGAEWLLLLDQDTELTQDYIHEVMELTGAGALDPRVAMIVPKLEMGGVLLSPYVARFRGLKTKVTRETRGVVEEPLMAFNSGAVMRVSAMRAIGGFPEAYWLDYLDHATMHQLMKRQGKMYVMASVLQHELSELQANAPVNLARLENRLRAEARYFREYGTRREHLLSRWDLLRQTVGHARRGRVDEAKVRLRVLFSA